MNFFMPVHISVYPNCIQQATELNQMGKRALMITSGNSSALVDQLERSIGASGSPQIVSKYDLCENLLCESHMDEICFTMEQIDADLLLTAGSDQAISAGKLCRRAYADQAGKRIPLVLCPLPRESGDGVTPYACFQDHPGQIHCEFSASLYADLLLLDTQRTKDDTASLWAYALVEAMAYLLEAMVRPRGSLFSRGFVYDALADICFGLKSLNEDLVDSIVQEVMARSILKAGIVAGQSEGSLLYAMKSRLSYRKGIPSGRAAARLLRSYTEYLQSRESHKVQSFFSQIGFRNMDEFVREFCFLFPENQLLSLKEAEEIAAEIADERRVWGLRAPEAEEITRILDVV